MWLCCKEFKQWSVPVLCVFQASLVSGHAGMKFTVLETLDHIKEEFQLFQAQYHRYTRRNSITAVFNKPWCFLLLFYGPNMLQALALLFFCLCFVGDKWCFASIWSADVWLSMCPLVSFIHRSIQMCAGQVHFDILTPFFRCEISVIRWDEIINSAHVMSVSCTCVSVKPYSGCSCLASRLLCGWCLSCRMDHLCKSDEINSL